MSLSNLQNTWNAKVLSKSDKEAQVEFSGKWVNYLGPDGNWAPINCTLVPNAEGWSVTDAPFNFNAPKFADDEAFFESDVRWDIWGQEEITDDPFGMYIKADLAQHVEGELFDINGDGQLDAVIYRNAFPTWGADLIYYVRHGRAPRLEKLVQFNSNPGVSTEELQIPFAIRYTEELTIKEKIKTLKPADITRIKKHTDKRDVENAKKTKQSHLKARKEQVAAFEAGRKVWTSKKTRTDKSVMHRPNGGSTMRGIGMKDFYVWDSGDILQQKKVQIDIDYKKVDPFNYIFIKVIPTNFFADAVFPVYTDTVSTFYPDPHTESTSVDGTVYRDSGSTDWATTHDQTVAVAATPSGTEFLMICDKLGGGGAYRIGRGVILFDTSSIDTYDNIDSVVLSLWLNSKNDNQSDSFGIVQSVPASNTDLVVGDYDGFTVHEDTATSEATLASMGVGAYKAFTFDATGRGWIDNDGITKLGVRYTQDYSETTSHSSAPSTAQSDTRIATADTAGTTNDPKLVITHTTPAPPIAPSGLSATASDGSVDIVLTWTDNSSTEDGFEVERSDDGATGWALINTTAANAVTYTDTSLGFSTQKYYRIRSDRVGVGESAYTSVVNATTAPAAPSAFAVTHANGSSVLSFTWTEASSDETSFSIEESATGSGGWAEVETPAANDTSDTHDVAAFDTRKYYRIKAVRSGDSIDSSWSSTVNEITPPAAPSALALSTSQGALQFRVSWTDNSSTETTFSIERRKAGDDAFAEITTDTTTPYDDTGLDEETLYFYRIRAYNATDTVYSAYTAVVSARTLSPKPTNLRALPNEETSVMLLWDDASLRSTGVKVERSLDDAAWGTLATTAKGALQYENTGLTNGTTYYYRVSSVGPDGTSAVTASVSVVADMATNAGMEFAINKKLNSFPSE